MFHFNEIVKFISKFYKNLPILLQFLFERTYVLMPNKENVTNNENVNTEIIFNTAYVGVIFAFEISSSDTSLRYFKYQMSKCVEVLHYFHKDYIKLNRIFKRKFAIYYIKKRRSNDIRRRVSNVCSNFVMDNGAFKVFIIALTI